MRNRRMRTRMYGGVRGRKTKKVGRNSKIFVFLLLDLCHRFSQLQTPAGFRRSRAGVFTFQETSKKRKNAKKRKNRHCDI